MQAGIKPQICCTGHGHNLRPGRWAGLGGQQRQAARCGHTLTRRACRPGKSPHNCTLPSLTMWEALRVRPLGCGACKHSVLLS